MSTELYLVLVISSAFITVLIAEALKCLLRAAETPYRANIVALDVAMICSTLVALILKTCLRLGLSFSPEQIVRLLLVIISTWGLSMFIYDKGVQTVEQYKKYKEMKEEEKNVEELCVKALGKYSEMVKGGCGKSSKNHGTDGGCNNRNDSDNGRS